LLLTRSACISHCNRNLARLIHAGQAKPSQIISHVLAMADAPNAYE
jgi:threonine dehydrogenase-like Zn-dependent dehydrogenase